MGRSYWVTCVVSILGAQWMTSAVAQTPTNSASATTSLTATFSAPPNCSETVSGNVSACYNTFGQIPVCAVRIVLELICRAQRLTTDCRLANMLGPGDPVAALCIHRPAMSLCSLNSGTAGRPAVYSKDVQLGRCTKYERWTERDIQTHADRTR